MNHHDDDETRVTLETPMQIRLILAQDEVSVTDAIKPRQLNDASFFLLYMEFSICRNNQSFQ